MESSQLKYCFEDLSIHYFQSDFSISTIDFLQMKSPSLEAHFKLEKLGSIFFTNLLFYEERIVPDTDNCLNGQHVRYSFEFFRKLRPDEKLYQDGYREVELFHTWYAT